MKRILFALLVLIPCLTPLARDASGKFEALLGFTLNQANLGEITQRLGATKRFDVPDGHYEYAVCYQAKDSNQIVIFSSSLEFGGNESELLDFSVQEANQSHFPCAVSTIKSALLQLDGLRLGISEDAFQAAVGGGAERNENGDLECHLDTTRPLSAAELKQIAPDDPDIYKRPVIDVSHNVWGRFHSGRLIAFGSGKLETL